MNPAPLLPFWEKGLGDEGQLSKLRCSRSLFNNLPIFGLIN